MKIGLRLKWITMVVSFILLISIVIYLVSIRQGVVTMERELHERGLTLARGLSYNSEYGLFTRNKGILNNLIKGVMEAPDVSYCGIYDENRVVFVSSGDIKKSLPIDTETKDYEVQHVKLEKAEYFDIVIPVFTKTVAMEEAEIGLFISEEEWIGEVKRPEKEVALEEKREVVKKIIGFVQVGISELRALENINKFKASIAGISGLVILFGILVTIFFVNRLVKPIYLLSLATQSVAKGDFSQRLDIKSKDEVGILGESFNRMTGELKRTTVSKDYVDNIIKSMIDTLIVVTPEGNLQTVNHATADLLGYKEEELVGKPFASIFTAEAVAEAEEVTPFKGTRMKKLIEEGSIRDYGMTYKTKSGEKIPVNFSGSVMRDKEGELLGIVGVARDMREIKRLMQKEKELAVQAAAAEVERKRATELEKAYKKLQEAQDMLIQAEKLNAVGQLASGVAHEVRNPLGIIIQGVDYLEMRISPKQKDIVETLTMLKGSVRRADKIINSLLDFSRPTKLDLHPEDINSILEDSLTLVKARFEFENIDIIRETKKDMPKALVDKNKIEQVFVNALLNAIQAMPEGGKIIIRSFDKQLEEVKNGIGKREEDRFKVGEKAVIVEIEDTGPGIPEEKLKKVFDPFFTTKGSSGGSGLGLSVSRNIITMHKGLIDIKSQINKGTKVIIALKIAGK